MPTADEIFGTQRAKTKPSDLISRVHKPAIHALLLADILFTSRLYRAINPEIMQPMLLGAIASIILVYGMIAVLRLQLLIVYALLLSFGMMLLQLNVFAGISYSTINYNSAFQFIGLPTFVVFYILSKEGMSTYLLRTLVIYATGYTLLYLIMGILYQLHALPAGILGPLVLTDIERGERLFCYSTTAAFALFYWLYEVRRKPQPITVAFFIGCLLAVILTLSRVYILFVFTITILYWLKTPLKAVKLICLTALVAISIINLYGFVDPSWNPYSLFAGDSSGGFRALEYNIARSFLASNYWFGAGIPPDSKNSWFVFAQDFFSSGDLGILGVWLDWGLLGFILFFIGSYLATMQAARVERRLGTPLFMTGCLMAGYGCLAPVIFSPDGATYFAIIFGLWLARMKLSNVEERSDFA